MSRNTEGVHFTHERFSLCVSLSRIFFSPLCLFQCCTFVVALIVELNMTECTALAFVRYATRRLGVDLVNVGS